MADLPKEEQENSSTAKLEEALAATRKLIQSNVGVGNERFIRSVAGRMLERGLDSDWPEQMKLQARFHARLIEDTLQEVRNAPNRAIVVSGIWAALSLAQCLATEDVKWIQREARVETARAAGKKSGASRGDGLWQPRAEELALQARRAHPTWSNAEIALYIFNHWRLPGVRCPGQKWLTAFLSKLQNGGRLS
jgi:hypothetical protein